MKTHERELPQEESTLLDSPLGRVLVGYFGDARFMRTAHVDPSRANTVIGQLDIMAAKLDELGGYDHQFEVPELTIGIPVAEESEDLDSIRRTLQQISKTKTHFGGHVEVIVWSNVIGPSRSSSSGRYRDIRSVIEPFARPGLEISLAHDSIRLDDKRESMFTGDGDIMPMSVVRQHMMDAIISRAYHRGYSMDHPVMWLDADTTFIQSSSFNRVVNKAHSGMVSIFQPRLDYHVDWLGGDDAELDYATRIFIIDEVMRRRFRKSMLGGQIPGEYQEECGSFFPLSAYLLAGGLSPTSHETGHLLDQLSHTTESVDSQLLQRYREVMGAPDTAFDLDESCYVPEVRIGTSARRHYKEISTHGSVALQVGRTASVLREYKTFQEAMTGNTCDEVAGFEVSVYPDELEGAIMSRYPNPDPETLTALRKLVDKHFINQLLH